MKQKRKGSIPIDILYLPALVLLTVFVIYPLISGVQISFTNWNGYSSKYKYVGLANYVKMFHDKMFYTALKNTFIYGVGSTTIQTIVGVAYALLLQKRFHGQTLTRVIVYLPAMIASLIMGYISYFLVQYNHGAINDIMILFGKEAVDWMADGKRAVWIIVVINALQFVGKTMIIMIAGLQGIPESYEEAAEIDGAGYLEKLQLYYAAIAASGNYHQRGIKPDRRIEAVWNHPVYDFRWTWVFLPFTLNPDQLPVLPEPERRLFRSSWALSVCDYHDPWYGCPPFPGEESGGA